MGTTGSQITSLVIVYSTVYSGADKNQSSTSLAFVRGFHRRPVISWHKGPVTRKFFSFDDVSMVFVIAGITSFSPSAWGMGEFVPAWYSPSVRDARIFRILSWSRTDLFDEMLMTFCKIGWYQVHTSKEQLFVNIYGLHLVIVTAYLWRQNFNLHGSHIRLLKIHRSPLYWHDLSEFDARKAITAIIVYIIAHPSPNFNKPVADIRACTSYLIPLANVDVITFRARIDVLA